MSTVPQFTGKARGIFEALMGGEEVDEIVRRLDTKPGYVYNIRARAKKAGIILGPPETLNLQANNQQREQPLQPPQNLDQKPAVTPQPAAIAEHPTPNVPMRIIREPDAILSPRDFPDARDIMEFQQVQQQLNQQLQQLQQLQVPRQLPARPPTLEELIEGYP